MLLLANLRRRLSPDQPTVARVEWRVISTASGLLAGVLTRKLLNLVWAKCSPSEVEPPLNPIDRRVGWGEAIVWSIAAGAGVGVARMVSDRFTARAWELAVGQSPPGVDADTD